MFSMFVSLLRWLNTVWPFVSICPLQNHGKRMVADNQAETWQVKNILMKDFYWQVKCDVFVITKWPPISYKRYLSI